MKNEKQRRRMCRVVAGRGSVLDKVQEKLSRMVGNSEDSINQFIDEINEDHIIESAVFCISGVIFEKEL